MANKKHRLLLGAHMSIAGGLEKSIERGTSIGCTTIQIFLKSNRQWRAKPLTQKEIALFKATAAKSAISPVVAHATYLINLASPNKSVEKASIDSVINELKRCDQLGIPYLVLHPGSYVTSNPEQALYQIIKNINYILQTCDTKALILLETMAGQGSALCSNFEQIATIIKNSENPRRLGVCVDTCHAFVAGYDFRTLSSYEKLWLDFDSIIGLSFLKVIHINDSKKDIGSKVDRHEHIGKGKIGLTAFELLFNDTRFFDIPKILETPNALKEPFTEDKMNMATIYSLLSSETKKILRI